MTFLGAIGFYLLEISLIKGRNNQNMRIKIPLIMSVHSLTFFIFGIGLALDSDGGFVGKQYFLGNLHEKKQYDKLAYYFAASVTMAMIASQTVVQRVSINVHFFLSILSNTLIFALVVSLTMEEGYFDKLGFKDFGGAASIHVCAGIIGLVSTLLAGPRIRTKNYKQKLEYLLEKENFEDNY
jgi:ammonia channel protein AmtB